jgi:UDP-glucose 4-epimerase
MILITGGHGFIGPHTAHALLDLGEPVVLTRYRTAREPDFLAAELGVRAHAEAVDLNDRKALLALGERHSITGIVHLAEGGIGVPSLTDEVALSAAPLLNVLAAAHTWGVPRVTVASAIGVYMHINEIPLREDVPLPLTASHPIELMKKTSELISSFLAARAGFEIVTMRISGVYGPLYRGMSSLGIPAHLVHAAVNGRELPAGLFAEDGIDWCYVKDCGRAIALLQTAGALNHRVYNVGAGFPTRNREFVAAIRKAIPDAPIELPAGHNPEGAGKDIYLDTSRLRADTGFEPQYDVYRGMAEYVDWLRAGNPF